VRLNFNFALSIRLLVLQDYDTWIELAEEVEPLFGPMIDSNELQNGIKIV
jgi:hypothetical protein